MSQTRRILNQAPNKHKRSWEKCVSNSWRSSKKSASAREAMEQKGSFKQGRRIQLFLQVGNNKRSAASQFSTFQGSLIPSSWLLLETCGQKDQTSLTAVSPHPPWPSHKTDPRFSGCSLNKELLSCVSKPSDTIPDV